MNKAEADGALTVEAAIIAYRDCERLLRMLVENPASRPPDEYAIIWPIIAKNLSNVADLIGNKASALEAMLVNSVDVEGRA
jgi:hypothetical protein